MKKKDIRSAIIYLCSRDKSFPSIAEISEHTGYTFTKVKELLDKLCNRNFIEKLPSGNYNLNPHVILTGEEKESKEEAEISVLPEKIMEGMLDRTIEKIENNKPEFLIDSTAVGKFDISNTESEIIKRNGLQALLKKVTSLSTPFNKDDIVDAATNLNKFNYEYMPKTNKSLIVPVTRILMTIIGVGAAAVSVFYTSVWLVEFLPSPLALLLSSIIVGFSILAFEVIIMFFSGIVTKHWSRWLVICCFIFLWIVVAVFSITSTIAGQYNQHIKNSKEYAELNVSKKADNMKWNSIQERKAELIERRAEKKLQLSNHINVSNQITTIKETEKHAGSLSSTNYRIQQAENALNKIEADIEKIREEERRILSVDPTKAQASSGDVPDFYSWLAKVLNIKKDLAQFWLSLFPAIFVDLISPAAIAIAMFLKRKEE